MTKKEQIEIAQKMRGSLNKKIGKEVAFDVSLRNPAAVTKWISTGSTILDLSIEPGKIAGIPVGRITEMAGLEASAKSYLAACIAKNAIKQHDMTIVYFDSESSIDAEFWRKMGLDIEEIVYVQALNVEFVLETIEHYLSEFSQPMLFIWDSLAATSAKAVLAADFNPNANVGVKARVLSSGVPRLLIPLANHGSAFLVLNQLRDNLNLDQRSDRLANPFIAPGGKAMAFLYSLRIWLTKRQGKDTKILDDGGNIIGTTIRTQFKKSRFGSEGRKAEFSILWGGPKIVIQDEESWLLFLKENGSPNLTSGGPWNTLTGEGGFEKKFQKASWVEELREPKFRKAALDALEAICKAGTKFEEPDGEEESDIE
jgi:RecA/RadA recombinase